MEQTYQNFKMIQYKDQNYSMNRKCKKYTIDMLQNAYVPKEAIYSCGLHWHVGSTSYV